MILLTPFSGSGYNVPPNYDSPVWLIAAIAAAVGISVLLDRIARKKRQERPGGEEEAPEAPDDGGESGKNEEE